MDADLVLTGGVVWCGLGRPRAEAVAMRQGRIMAVGTTTDMRGLIGPDTRVIDLRGRFAMPGLNDAHMHLLPVGIAMNQVDLRPDAAPTLAALLQALAARFRV